MADLQSYTIQQFDGGIADRPNKGVKGAFRFGWGINLRDGLSGLTPNQKLKKDSGTVVVDRVDFMIPATDGNMYGFGNAGNIYKRTAGGAWSLVYTDPDGAIKGALEFEHNNGSGSYVPHMVWATQTKVKKVVLASGFGAPTEVGTFAKGVAGDWHPMSLVQGVLEIGDGDRVAMIDYEGAWNNSALRIPTNLKVQAIIENGEQAVIGATERASSTRGWAFTWNRTDPSWGVKRKIGSGINALTFFESGMLIQSGLGYLKYWDLVNLIPLKKIPGGGQVRPGGTDDFKEVPHFAVSGGDKNGVYSYGRNDKNGSFSLNLEYLPSPVLAASPDWSDIEAIEAKMADAALELGAFCVFGDAPFVAWKDGETYGVDTLDPDNKMPAVFEGLIFTAEHPEANKIFRYVKAVAATLPEDTSVRVEIRTNGNGTEWQETKRDDGVEEIQAGERGAVFSLEGEGEEYEIRVILIPNGNSAPDIKSLNTYYEYEGIF